MKKARIATLLGVGLIFVGLIFHVFDNSLYISFFVLGLTTLLLLSLKRLGAVAALIRTNNRHLDEIKRDAASSRTLTSWYGKQLLDFGGSIFKRVDSMSGEVQEVKNLEPKQQTKPSRPLGARESIENATEASPLRSGRVSTPDVKNPKAKETMATMLDAERDLVVGGVFASDLLVELQAKARVWRPGTVKDLLENHRPDLVVLDERYIAHGQWFGTFQASGTNLMKELLSGLEWAIERGVPVFVVPDNSVPAVNSFALRHPKAVIFPLDESDLNQSFGAASSEVVMRISKSLKNRE